MDNDWTYIQNFMNCMVIIQKIICPKRFLSMCVSLWRLTFLLLSTTSSGYNRRYIHCSQGYKLWFNHNDNVVNQHIKYLWYSHIYDWISGYILDCTPATRYCNHFYILMLTLVTVFSKHKMNWHVLTISHILFLPQSC